MSNQNSAFRTHNKLDSQGIPELQKSTVFLPKPPGYKTANQWRKEGMCPKDSGVFEEYAATNAKGEVWLDSNGKPNVYSYISPENVVPIEQKKIASFASVDRKNIVCFDTETTGFTKWDEIIQITISDGNGEVLLNTFIKPVNKKSWRKASEINHIYPEDVKDAPTAKDLRSKIKSIFERADLVIGHNVPFDIRMVEQCFYISLKDKPVFDTLDYFRKDTPEGSHKLANAVEHYCPEIMAKFEAGAHKSDTDVWATVKVFEKMAEKEQKRNSGYSFASKKMQQNENTQTEIDFE